jgi:hypothetical protein
MNSQNRSISVFFALTAILAVFTGRVAQAEERSQDKQQKPFFTPGQGYEQEPEYKFSGVIRQIPTNGVAGVWIIDDRLIVVSPLTVIKEEKAKAAVGASVDVKGLLKGMDFMATEIEVTGSGKS